ncbi:VOC family protein [Novosphingobium resinovorum]|uniref:VOC family protein n=1 Tax=Sphingomonadaceae TaxID=41297 RepID=UPI00027CC22C|nr:MULTISPECIES: VOC family protein [Sphingomonadaceae]EJU14295.1 glyoxalase/bleomycin resistance protein/dioxygenase [Sphingomonas sp. LH128]MBF7014022.1 VOC family protein [Novosphingobium sp. HR1a]WJM26166.1 VOC family protein [Novosphingobium resinovorum]
MVRPRVFALTMLIAVVANATTAIAVDAPPPGTPGIDGHARPAIDASGLDHVGMNVPDASEAAEFFHDLMGTRIVSDWSPAPVDAQWKKRFRWHASARLKRLMMIEARDGSKIELFEYASPAAAHKQPREDDAGATHIALRANDPTRAIAAVRAMGLTILNDPVTLPDGSRWFYFLSPWGSQVELVFPSER